MMLVYARGKNHDARLVVLLARLLLVRLVKKPVRYIPNIFELKKGLFPLGFVNRNAKSSENNSTMYPI